MLSGCITAVAASASPFTTRTLDLPAPLLLVVWNKDKSCRNATASSSYDEREDVEERTDMA